MFWISGLSIICFVEASRTFNGLPFNGNTPYLSLPTISIPAIASALAESPSVRINVQSSHFFVPASLASSSFGTPSSLFLLVPLSVLAIFACNLAWAWRTMESTIPDWRIYLRNLSEIVHLDPNYEGFVVSVSFVWESNAGFSMLELTNIQSYCLIWKFLILSFSFLYFFFTSLMILLHIRSVIEFT